MFILMCRENRLALEQLLKDHSSKILGHDEDDTFRIKVRRRHIREDSLTRGSYVKTSKGDIYR